MPAVGPQPSRTDGLGGPASAISTKSREDSALRASRRAGVKSTAIDGGVGQEWSKRRRYMARYMIEATHGPDTRE
jgi:hypothetical protein